MNDFSFINLKSNNFIIFNFFIIHKLRTIDCLNHDKQNFYPVHRFKVEMADKENVLPLNLHENFKLKYTKLSLQIYRQTKTLLF